MAALLGMVLIAGGVVGYVAWPGSEGNAAVVVDAGVAVTFDAAVPDAGVPDAVVVDAGVPDARGRTVVRKRIDAGVKPRGTARLKVGANPWGEVYLDGKRLGRAPGEWTIPSGRHQVEVRFPVPGREQSKRFRINVRAGGAESLGVVDFTGR